MPSHNTMSNRANNRNGYRVKTTIKVDSGLERASRGKKPWVGGTPPKRKPNKRYQKGQKC